ncbi:MAG: TolC family protein [Burkholderiales bacterium]|nr:TolC family protein [Burkholderiales bacterium]
MLKWFSIIAIVFTMFGCSYFAPDYHKPQMDIPDKWSANNLNITPISESLPYLAWWQKFNDPELNYYIESSLKNNLTIQGAKISLDAAQSQLSTVKLNWIPMLNLFGGTIGGASQNSFAPIGNLGLIGNSGAFFAILPAYTLNIFTNYTLQKQAQYNLEAAKNAELRVRLGIIGQVTTSYFTNLAQIQLIEQLTALDKNTNQLITITQALDKQGLSNSISVEELKSKQQLVKGQLIIAQKNLLATQNALRYLMNQTPGTIIFKNSFTNINANQIIPGNLPITVIDSRPDIMEAEDRLKAANEGISVTSSGLLPSVNLNYFFAQGAGTQSFNNPVSVSTSNSNQQSYYAAYANWNIAPSIFGQINVSKATFKAALNNYQQVVNAALHEIDNALANNNAYNQKMNSDNQAYKNINNIIQSKEALHRRGLTTNMLVLMSKIEQNLMAIDMTQTKLQQLVSLVVVYQSLGGGYLVDSESKTVKEIQ